MPLGVNENRRPRGVQNNALHHVMRSDVGAKFDIMCSKQAHFENAHRWQTQTILKVNARVVRWIVRMSSVKLPQH